MNKASDCMLTNLVLLPKLTDKQYETLAFLANFFRKHQYYPSRKEIAVAMGVTSNAINQHIKSLEKKGYVVIEVGEHRNIRITDRGVQRLQITAEEIKE